MGSGTARTGGWPVPPVGNRRGPSRAIARAVARQNGPEPRRDRARLASLENEESDVLTGEAGTSHHRLRVDLRHRIRIVQIDVKPNAASARLRNMRRPAAPRFAVAGTRRIRFVGIIDPQTAAIEVGCRRKLAELGKFLPKRRDIV